MPSSTMTTTTTTLQPMSTSISLPPIRSIAFHPGPEPLTSSPPVVHPLPPPPPRTLPPLPYPHPTQAPVHHHQEYTSPRPLVYQGIPSPYHQHHQHGRLPLPLSAESSITLAPNRHLHKTKEVKRRTKTGCLTCRKRRIKCDEGRPECRNCMKSKRLCQGYDPIFQSQAPPALHPAPTSNLPNSSSVASSSARTYGTDAANPRFAHEPSSIGTARPPEHSEYPFRRTSEPSLPPLSRPYQMDVSAPATSSQLPRSRRTMEEVCMIQGHRAPNLPPLPPDSTPNLESIQKIYDVAFAPGLDKFLESGQTKWFAREGFNHLVADRALLAQVLAYLTLINNSHSIPGPNPALASQEARVTWAMLNLSVRVDHDSGEEAERLSRRIKAVESLLTGDPAVSSRASIADFVHQEEGDSPEVVVKGGTAFDKQLARRSEDFWKAVETAGASQGRPSEVLHTVSAQCQLLSDGIESRDIVYSLLLLGSGGDSTKHNEQELARRYLEHQAGGRATNQVFSTLAGMALRAFPAR